MGNAIARLEDNGCTQTPVVEENFRDRLRGKVKAKILEYTPRQIVKATGRTRECAKNWLDPEDKRMPDGESLIRLAQSFPPVNQMLAEECGWNRAAQAQSVDGVIRCLHKIAARDDDEGRMARQLLGAIAQLTKQQI